MTKATRIERAKYLEKSLLRCGEQERAPVPTPRAKNDVQASKVGDAWKLCTELGLIRSL
jgi:hypothetical protein